MSGNMNCGKCNVELTDDNWCSSNKKNHRYTCKSCKKEYNKRYYKDHKKEIAEYKKQWYQEHPGYQKEYKQENEDHIKEYNKQYAIENKEKILENNRKYKKTPDGKITSMKYIAKRRRELGYNPLNEWFEGCEGHHLDNVNIIHVPEDLHQLISHNQYNSKNMDIINLRAWDFLEMSVI